MPRRDAHPQNGAAVTIRHDCRLAEKLFKLFFTRIALWDYYSLGRLSLLRNGEMVHQPAVETIGLCERISHPHLPGTHIILSIGRQLQLIHWPDDGLSQVGAP
jgi:hypothetical protein